MDNYTVQLVKRSRKSITESLELLARINSMPNPKRPRDVNQLAKMIVDLSTGDETETLPEQTVKQKAGRLGGLKGGITRAAKLTPEERSAIAKQAAQARWDRTKNHLKSE